VLNLPQLLVRPVRAIEKQRFQQLMQQHHYLGALPKIGETLWYVTTFADQWVALLGFSAVALKCSARDRWIGWEFGHRYARIKSDKTGNQQQPFSNPARLAFCQLSLPESILVPKAPGGRLAGAL